MLIVSTHLYMLHRESEGIRESFSIVALTAKGSGQIQSHSRILLGIDHDLRNAFTDVSNGGSIVEDVRCDGRVELSLAGNRLELTQYVLHK